MPFELPRAGFREEKDLVPIKYSLKGTNLGKLCPKKRQANWSGRRKDFQHVPTRTSAEHSSGWKQLGLLLSHTQQQKTVLAFFLQITTDSRD